MTTTKKNKAKKSVKKDPKVIITKGRGIVAPEDTLFPKKLEKANYILSRTEFVKDSNTPGLINIFE